MRITILRYLFLFSISSAFGGAYVRSQSCAPVDIEEMSPCDRTKKPQGWSIDLGGTYTWMAFTTPPTYSGSTGGIQGKLTYQKPNAFFGQARFIYNLGPLSSSLNKAAVYEWYSEFVGGFCFYPRQNWTFTPYAGLGFDFLHDNHRAYSSLAPIKLRYSIYYALVGFDTHYTWKDWMLGLQVDCLPTFNQYLQIKTLSGEAWTLKNRTGVAVRIPAAYRLIENFWMELAPYYRFLPIGASNTLLLPKRNLNQWGFFLTFRYFI